MTSSLFDNVDTWKADPLEAFRAFVLSPEFQLLGRRKAAIGDATPPPMRLSSARIYILMFGKFLRWLRSNNLDLMSISNVDILAFLEHGSEEKTENAVFQKKDLNSSIRIRYLRIFERVFQHLNIHPNPARHAAFDIYKSADRKLQGSDLEKVVMSAEEQLAFMQALPPAKTSNTDSGHAGWKRRRDRAMQAMMLGAGLKVSEVIGIVTDNVGTADATGCVPIAVSPASTAGTSRWHQTQLRQFAVQEVFSWKAERTRLNIPGKLLFPANLNGGLLDKATVYRQVKATFARAEIDVQRLGGRTLRNSFAVRELSSGSSIELVGEFLGHRKRKSTEQYLLETAPKIAKPN